MTNAIKPHDKIQIAMITALVNNFKTCELTQYLKRGDYKFTKAPKRKFSCNSVHFTKINQKNTYDISSNINYSQAKI